MGNEPPSGQRMVPGAKGSMVRFAWSGNEPEGFAGLTDSHEKGEYRSDND